MLSLFTILPFFFMIGTTYYYNKKVMNTTKSHLMLTSVLEATLSYIVIIMLFLQGFIISFSFFIVIFFILLILSYITVVIDGVTGQKGVLELETTKNSILLFCITILPFYVALTVFRFLPFYFQISLSIILVLLLVFVKSHITPLLSSLYSKIARYYSISGAKEWMIIWSVIAVMIASVVMFDFPFNRVSEILNLSNNTAIFSFDSFPTDMNNNYRQRELSQFELNESLDAEVLDYYQDNEYLYVFTNRNQMRLFDLSSNQELIIPSSDLEESNRKVGSLSEFGFKERFLEYQNNLYFISGKSIYTITPSTVKHIATFSSPNIKYFFDNNVLHILDSQSPAYQNVYIVDNESVTLIENFNMSVELFDPRIVISNELFLITDNKYILKSDPSVFFVIGEGRPLYHSEEKAMYFSYQTVEATVSDDYLRTIHSKRYALKHPQEMTLKQDHNTYGQIINDKIFFTEPVITKYYRVEIMNNDFEFEAIMNHQELQPFWIGNRFTKSYIVSYLVQDDQLRFLQVDQNKDTTIFSLYEIEEVDVDIPLPFYTHYGLLILVPIIVSFLIPPTHYRFSKTETKYDAFIFHDTPSKS